MAQPVVLYVSVGCPWPHYHALSPFIIDDNKPRDIMIHDVNRIVRGLAQQGKLDRAARYVTHGPETQRFSCLLHCSRQVMETERK